MSIPAAVETVLNAHHINYGLTETPQFCTSSIPISQYISWAGATRSVVLADDKGQLQAIIPADSLLDVSALNKLTGRDLRAIPSNELQTLVDAKDLFSLPAIPQITGFPTVVDETVLSQPEVVLESGADNGLLRLKQQDFKQILQGAVIADISAPIPAIHFGNQKNDIEEITKALGQFTSMRIQQRLEDTLEFPPLPDTAQRIIKLRVDPKADIKDLSDIVEVDPPLAAQVVSWAASPYYAAPGPIKSVHDAIVRVLGFDLVMNLSLGLSLGKTLLMPKDAPRGFSGYWHQSVYTAAIIEELIKAIPAKQRPEMGMACLSGLLHNFGYLVLATVFPPYFSLICRHLEANPHAGHAAIERHLLGIDRDQMNSWLMELWTMPDQVCAAIRHQNNPDYDGPEFEYANLLFVAGRLLRQNGIGDAPLEEIPAALFQRLNLSADKAQSAVENVLACAEELQTIANDISG